MSTCAAATELAPSGAWDLAQEHLPANLAAALLLAANPVLRRLGLPHPTVREVLEATKASKTRAYELRNALGSRLRELAPKVGRPPKPRASEPPDVLSELSRASLRYLFDHPGAVTCGREGRRTYADGFRLFVLELCERHPDLDTEAVAGALELPLTTLRDWLRVEPHVEPHIDAQSRPQGTGDSSENERAEEAAPGSEEEPLEESGPLPESSSPEGEPDPRPLDPSPDGNAPASSPLRSSSDERPNRLVDLHVQTVLAQWKTWKGRFSRFCEHLRQHHQIPFGRSTIASILEHAGERAPKRRKGRSPDEKALRNAFVTFFPGAQWTADGSPVCAKVEGELFVFNLELCVDTKTDAFVGVDVRDHEDADAVLATFDEGVEATGAPPFFLLLDNRPSNHTSSVDEALGDTQRMRATSGRAQNKAHVEGGFGLFSQNVPPLVVEGSTPKERARQLVDLIARTFFGALNHRPRPDCGGLSRVELYQQANPTPEEVEKARAALRARLERQERARQTRRARSDPATRSMLEAAFRRLALEDPQGHIQDAIARYPLAQITEGIAIFEGKKTAGTLPKDVGGRYLLGIVRNLAQEHEGISIALALWQRRLEARDAVFGPLLAHRSRLEHEYPQTNLRLRSFVDQALAADRHIERFFWLRAAADLVEAQPPKDRHPLFTVAARRIASTYRVPHPDRLRATRLLAAEILPLA